MMRRWNIAITVTLIILVQLVTGEPSTTCRKVPDISKIPSDEKCCEMPEYFNKTQLEECASEMKKDTKKDAKQDDAQGGCQFVECLMKKNDYLKKDGELDAAQFGQLMKRQLKSVSADWRQLMEQGILQECLVMIEREKDTIERFVKPIPGVCHPSVMFMIYCITGKSIAKCPSASWTDSAVCNEWKTYLGSCSSSIEDIQEMINQVKAQTIARQ